MSIVLININNEFNISQEWLGLIIQSAGASGLIIMCFAKPDLLSFRWLAKLGDYSYVFYLVHFVVLLLCKSMFSNIIFFEFFALLISVTLTVSLNRIQKCVSHRLL